MTKHRLAPWLATSLIVAAGSALTFLVVMFDVPRRWSWYRPESMTAKLMLVSFGLTALWMIIFTLAIIVLRKRGLWLMLGLPGAMFGLIFVASFSYAIDQCHKTKPLMHCLP